MFHLLLVEIVMVLCYNRANKREVTVMDKLEKLGERINKYRTERGLSQLELSEQLEVSRQSISKWETDVAVPELSKLVKMAEIFGVSLDELVLGRAAENEEIKEEKEEAPAPAREEKPYSRIKAGMGFMFLGVGILLSFLVLLLASDILSALVIFIPFGLSALFCLRQFRHAALWCSISFFFTFEWYLYVASGARWDKVFSAMLYTDRVNQWMPLISWALFAALVFFIGMTLFVYRRNKFEYSRRKHTVLAAATLAALPLKHLAVNFYNAYFLRQILAGGDEHYYTVLYRNFRLLIPTVDYLIELAFLIAFTACLVPTFYWVLGVIKRKKENK